MHCFLNPLQISVYFCHPSPFLSLKCFAVLLFVLLTLSSLYEGRSAWFMWLIYIKTMKYVHQSEPSLCQMYCIVHYWLTRSLQWPSSSSLWMIWSNKSLPLLPTLWGSEEDHKLFSLFTKYRFYWSFFSLKLTLIKRFHPKCGMSVVMTRWRE